MMKKLVVCLVVLVCASVLYAQQSKALFYLTRSPDGVRSFYAHADKIDILVPTWYEVDADGLVSGGPDPAVLAFAKEHHVEVMPIVASSGFKQEPFHKLITNSQAYGRMIEQLIVISKQNEYAGFQFDFENIAWTDRDTLSSMVASAASAFHREGLQLSIATVPNAPGAAGQSTFSAWLYANWRGAYDLKALAQSVDLICLMTYDQHTRWTPPGPVGGWGWTTENLDYALKSVPKEKLSLGIALYGYHWFAGPPQDGDKPNPSAQYIGGQDALDLARSYDGKIEWDPVDRTAWTYFYRDNTREWIFFTDERTFRERYNLVRDRGLQGFCSWVLGQEDPSIWNVLPSHK
ncbi:MAG TPA: glycosyl hydrolase family 18 protein [Pseudacidobacterium sp.]|jgi:spore germination protein YaaH|nr:glycosyl hydrolase family 18 protein [Pseudacidobacterium sp.]